MGWLYGWSTKKDLVTHVTKPWEHAGVKTRCLRQCWRGNCFSGVLWTVFHRDFPDGKQERFIIAFLMRCHIRVWGYKDVSESMGPCELSCPLSYLDLAPVPDGEYGKTWREQVRQYHAKRAKVNSRKLEVGVTYALVKGCTPDRVTITQLRPLRGVGPDGRTYRLRKKFVGDQVVTLGMPWWCGHS